MVDIAVEIHINKDQTIHLNSSEKEFRKWPEMVQEKAWTSSGN